MPASKKALNNHRLALNREAGIGDAEGRLPARVKPEAVNVNCTVCMLSLKMTKTNTEARNHWEARHPTTTFAACFPGQFDPTVAVVAEAAPAAGGGGTAKKAKAPADLSFLDDSLKAGKGKK